MRILTWNILAQSYYQNNRIDQSKRFTKILNQTLSYNPDVVCFQEVDSYDDWWRTALQSRGYTSYYAKRPTSGKNDGSMIAVKDSTTSIINTQTINLNNATPSKAPQELQQRYHRNNAGLIIRCIHNNRECVVATAHLYFDPKCLDVKLAQARYVWELIQQHATPKTPVFLAGDLNSEPHTEVVQHFKYYLNDPFLPQQKEGKVTTMTSDFSAWIDYILTNTEVQSVSKVPLLTHPIPNQSYPSDHIPLVIDAKI